MVPVISSLSVCLTVLLFPVLGITLPGPCPDVPPSDLIMDDSEMELIYSIPVSNETSSLIFREKGKLRRHVRTRISLNDNPKVIFVAPYPIKQGDLTIDTEVLKSDNVSLTVKSFFCDATGQRISTCLDEITENIRIWNVNSDWRFIWSCKDDEALHFHEEALLVLYMLYREEETKEPSEESARRLAKVFVDSLAQWINFSHIVEMGLESKVGPFFCTARFTEFNLKLWITCLVFSLMVVIRLFLCLMYK